MHSTHYRLPPRIGHARQDDSETTTPIHQSLARKALLPQVHAVDSGYVDSEQLLTAEQEFGVDLLGPCPGDEKWQARQKTGFALSDFRIDWEQMQVTCPAGQTSITWIPTIDKGKHQVIKVRFARKQCGSCPFAAQCTRSSPPRRILTLRPKAKHDALQANHQRQQGQTFGQHTLCVPESSQQSLRACVVATRDTHVTGG